MRGADIENGLAQVDFDAASETALIRVKRAEDYFGWFPQDSEQSLVHELLHIVFDTATDADGVFDEQAIDRLARVLVGLRRQTE